MKRALILATAALAGCASLPAAREMDTKAVPQAWAFAVPLNVTASGPWWSAVFPEPALAALVEQAGRVNTVEAALARTQAAQARLRSARSALYPSLSVEGSVSASTNDAADTQTATAELQGAFSRNLAGAEALRTRSAQASLAVAQARLAAARLDARSTAASLIVTSLSAQAQEQAAQRGLAAAEESLSLAQTRTRAGLDNALAVAQARTARDRAAALLPPLAQARIEARLGLEALLGLPTGALTAALEGPHPRTTASDSVPLIDNPIAVLSRRPDLQIALATLAVYDYDAAAAQADRWPTLSIGTTFGLSDANRGVDGTSASLLASVLQPLFDAGRREALADAAQADARAAAIEYDQAVRDAVGDVETSLNRVIQTQAARDAQAAAVASAAEQVRLARARYTSGLTTFSDVALADADLATAESNLASAEGSAADALVRLAQSLGLGADS
jgi:multidrug efflux system outer membrane protein